MLHDVVQRKKFYTLVLQKCLTRSRYTHISFLAEQGVPLEAIQDRVGHNRGSRVTNIYLHVTQKTKDTITPLIDSLTQQ